MKIRSLLLGSVAAAGLSTGAYAADLGVLTSLDVCDALGLSGLTISSDTNCLQITGSVAYEFVWGDYELGGPPPVGALHLTTGAGTNVIPAPGSGLGGAGPAPYDWKSRVDSWIKFVATADSDFGPAKAVLKLKDVNYVDGWGGPGGFGSVINPGSHTAGVVMDEAYVSIGDTTVIMAGKKGTIMNFGDDVPLNFLGLFNSEDVDVGVKWSGNTNTFGLPDGGVVIQAVTDLGNGVSVGVGLENLNSLNTTAAGTLVGVIAYAGDGIAAHATFAAGGVLDGAIENWGFHAGVSGSFDMIKFVAAVAADNSGYWNSLGSVSATFDMFTIAVSGEAVNTPGGLDWGVGGSLSAAVTDGVTINLGSRWYRDASGPDGGQAAAQLVAAVTESITLTGEVGIYVGGSLPGNVFYGAAQASWAPGGGYTSSLKGEVYSNGAYRATFKAAKTFE